MQQKYEKHLIKINKFWPEPDLSSSLKLGPGFKIKQRVGSGSYFKFRIAIFFYQNKLAKWRNKGKFGSEFRSTDKEHLEIPNFWTIWVEFLWTVENVLLFIFQKININPTYKDLG